MTKVIMGAKDDHGKNGARARIRSKVIMQKRHSSGERFGKRFAHRRGQSRQRSGFYFMFEAGKAGVEETWGTRQK
jgi:hypothetical protein